MLDTNVVSEFSRKSPNESVVSWVRQTQQDRLWISVLTLGELRQGIERLEPSVRRVQLRTWLDNTIVPRFADRMLPVDRAVAERWAHLTASLLLRGHVLPVIDSLLAATALVHGLTVVTCNVRDFAAAGVPVINPWE